MLPPSLAPTYVAGVGYIGEHSVTMTFNAQLDAAHPPTLDKFTLQIEEQFVTITSVAINSIAKTVTISYVGAALSSGNYIDFSYTDPSGDNQYAIQSLFGDDVASFSGSAVVQAYSTPAAPTLTSGSDSGTKGDGYTNDATPTLSGTATANGTVTLYEGGTQLGTTVADGSGNWSITTTSTLSDDSHTLTVIQSDSGKNASLSSSALTLTIDTEVEAPTTLALAIGSDSGKAGDGITKHAEPTITGHAEANATVKLYDSDDGTTELGSTTADGSGAWSIDSSTLSQGEHKLTAIQTDRAGNVSTASESFLYTLDNVSPTDLALSTSSVQLSAATNGATVATLSSTDAGAVSYGFAVGDNSNDADNTKFSIVDGDLVAAQNLSAGDYHIYLSATDAAGNEAYEFFTIAVIDGPAVTSIERVGNYVVTAATTSLDYTVTFSQAVTGVDLTDFVLNANGTATGVISSMIPLSDDTYIVTVSGISGDGEIGVSLKSSGTGIQSFATVGIVGGYTSGDTYWLDHTAAAAPSTPVMTPGTDSGISSSDAITSNTEPTFTGTAEANASVKLYDGGVLLATTDADYLGDWSFTNTKLGTGNHTLTVTQTDFAGNVSVVSDALHVVIDTTAAAAPALPVLATGSDSGALGDHITNDATPTITGTAEANATVKLYDTGGTILLGSTTANGSGAWSIDSSTLSDDVHMLTVTQTDRAGNVSAISAPLTLTIDTQGPAPITPSLSSASDSGTIGDGITNVARPVITGTAEANATVKLYDTNGTTVLGTATANGSGAWSITSSALSVGAHTLTVTQADAAGNISAAGEGLTLTIQARPVTPTTPPTNVDGVPVTQQPVTLPGGGTGTQIVIPVVTPGRDESSGSAGVADIPLASNGTGNLLLAQLSAGFGLTATGGASQPAGSSTDQLIQAILATTPGHSASDQGHLTGNGVTFLNQLASTVPLLVQTITPSGGATTTGGALTLTGTSTDTQHTALVIDTSNLSPGAQLVLNAVDFAAIVGAANVTGNTSGQILTGDLANQQFTVSAGSNSSVFSGGGSDTLVFTTTAAVAAGPGAGAQGATLPAGTTILHGGLGDDAASFNGASADYTVEAHDGYLVVTANAQPTQHALVINAESLKFSDTTVTVENRAALDSIAGLYQDVLGRQADYLGIESWANLDKAGVSLGTIALGIIASAESQAKHAMVFNGDNAHDVALLYQGIFSRAAEAGGVDFWVEHMANGMTLTEVATNFMLSEEAKVHKIGVQAWDFEVPA